MAAEQRIDKAENFLITVLIVYVKTQSYTWDGEDLEFTVWEAEVFRRAYSYFHLSTGRNLLFDGLSGGLVLF